MILIEKKVSHEIMNDRQHGDFGKQTLLEELQARLSDAKIPEVAKAELRDLARRLQQEKERYYARRIDMVVNTFGGIPGDYGVLKVPAGEEPNALSARHIAYDGKKLTYTFGSPFHFDGDRLIVSAGWITGNYRMTEDDITDFAVLDLAETMRFRLSFFRTGTAVSVHLFLAGQSEDFAEPAIAGKLFLAHICEGEITPEHQIRITKGGN